MKMLCRDCNLFDNSVMLCAELGKLIDIETDEPYCEIPDYKPIVFSRDHLFEIFSFRHFLSMCLVLGDGFDYGLTVYCRDSYRELYTSLIENPQEHCLPKVRALYTALDLFCKNPNGVQFFFYGRTSPSIPKGYDALFKPCDPFIMRDWKKYGAIVWNELEKAQQNMDETNEEEITYELHIFTDF